jgi:hypothetical protein
MVTKCCWSDGGRDDDRLNLDQPPPPPQQQHRQCQVDDCWDNWVRPLRRTEMVQVHVVPEQLHTMVRPPYPAKMLWRQHAWGEQIGASPVG